MINLLEIQEKENQGLLDVKSVNNKIEQLPENRGHYYITRNGKRRYDISQEALFENLLKYSYNSFRKMGIGSSFELQSPTGGTRIGELSMLATPEGREELEKRTKALSEQLQSQTSFYREEVKRYRDLLNSEVERDPSLTQRLPTGMIVNATRQIVDPSQWPLLAATSWIGGAVGGKVAGALGSKIAPATAKRIGAFVGRAVGEGIEEAIDEYSVDGEISAEGVISAGLGGGVIGEVPYLAKSLAGKLNLTKKAGKVAGDIKTEVAEKPLMQKLKDDYDEKVSEKRSSNRVDVDNMAEIAEATEIQGEMKGKVISAKETFEKSILIEGVTTEQAANEYLPKIAKHIIDNKLLKGVVDENSFFEAIISNGKAVKNVFRNLGRRKDLPEDLKTAIEWYNKVIDETRIKSVEVDPNKAVDNSIGVLEKPSEYKPIWRVPEEQMGHQADPVLHERDIYFSRIGKYAVDNQLIKGVDTVEKFLEEVKNNSRAARKFFRNVDRRKDLPDDVKEALEWYRKPEIEEAQKIETPENILEEIHGQYKPSKKELENFKIFKERLYKFLGIDKLNLEVSPKEQVELQRKIARTFGSFVKKIHNFKNIDEMIDYYKTKKGIDFELEIIPQKLGMLGETKLYSTVEGNKVKIVLTQETMQDMDLAMGILRHEIEHATDFIKKPDFDGRPYHWLTSEKDMTVADYFNASTGGHFSSDNNSMYELNYIAANMMNNMVYEGKLNKEVVKRLGFDMIPENPTDLELKMIETAVKEGAKETDALKRLAKLEKDLSVAFTTKRGLLEIAKMKTSVSNKSALMKAYIKTNILLPFERVENQMYNKIVKAFEIEYKGTKYNVPEIMNLFEMNNGDFVNWCFYWDKLPDELMDMGPQLQGLKATLLQIVDNIAEGTGATRMDIINTLNFDRNFTIESLIPEEDIPKFLKPDGTLDTDKLFSDTQITDKVTGKIVSERFAMYRDRFAEMNYGFFNSAKEVLIHELSRAEIDPKRVINVLIEARDCMKLDEYTNLLRKYQVEKIPEINDYLLKHQDLFQEKATLFGITPEDGIEKAIIESKKKNAKLFFMQDMESIKGTNRNPVLGGHLHRLGRFTHFVDEGLISKSNVSNFVKTNHVDSRLMMYKFLKDIPSSYAIKDTMPAGGWIGFKEVLNQVSHSIVDENKKTYLKDVEGYVKNEIGEKLGQITYPPRGTLDKVVSHILSGLNRVNLMGPKFLKELLQEPLGISENKIMLYGGQGFVDTYGDMLKATAILIESGERLRKINEVLGDRFHKSVSTEAFNIIRKDLDDVTGYFAKRRAKYGTKGEKIIHALTTGTEAMNWYSYSQTMMKLSSNLGAGHIIETWTKFSSLENLFSENTHYVKRIIRELEIDDVDFALLKKFSETNTFKELGIFDEVQFKNNLTPDDFSKLLGREITPDEFNLLRDATVKKVSKLNDKIANDISPTETTGGAKTEIESIKDPVLRNFVKLIGNFKSSIQEIWRRKLNAYYLSNIDPDTGKFDFSNKIYRKRILKNIFNKGAFIAALATVSNAEFYEDPQEYISEKIDELISNPVSPLWAAAQEDLNLWGLTTGANALTQPMAVMNNATKGKWDKAGKALIKMGIGKSNYDIGEKAYKYLFDD